MASIAQYNHRLFSASLLRQFLHLPISDIYFCVNSSNFIYLTFCDFSIYNKLQPLCINTLNSKVVSKYAVKYSLTLKTHTELSYLIVSKRSTRDVSLFVIRIHSVEWNWRQTFYEYARARNHAWHRTVVRRPLPNNPPAL